MRLTTPPDGCGLNSSPLRPYQTTKHALSSILPPSGSLGSPLNLTKYCPSMLTVAPVKLHISTNLSRSFTSPSPFQSLSGLAPTSLTYIPAIGVGVIVGVGVLPTVGVGVGVAVGGVPVGVAVGVGVRVDVGTSVGVGVPVGVGVCVGPVWLYSSTTNGRSLPYKGSYSVLRQLVYVTQLPLGDGVQRGSSFIFSTPSVIAFTISYTLNAS